jgi:hypothetical protein
LAWGYFVVNFVSEQRVAPPAFIASTEQKLTTEEQRHNYLECTRKILDGTVSSPIGHLTNPDGHSLTYGNIAYCERGARKGFGWQRRLELRQQQGEEISRLEATEPQ